MKKLFLFLLLFGFVTQIISAKNIVSSAIHEIIIEYFVKMSEKFNIFTEKNSSLRIMDISNDMLKKSDIPCKILQVYFNSKKTILRESAILLFDDMESYQKFHERLFYELISRTLNFLVYIENFTESKLRFAIDSTFTSELFLVRNNKESLSLVTFALFQQPNCRDWVKKEINQYNVQLGKWRSDRFFLEKFNNFNKCELIVRVPHNARPTSYVERDEKSNENRVKGHGIEFNDIISKSLNYSNYYNVYFLETGKQSNETLQHDFQLFALPSRLVSFHIKEEPGIVMTQPFRSIVEMILIPNDELYTPFEKLFLPFEAEVWIWLIATMTTAATVILVLKFSPRVKQQFVFGSKVKTPMLNLM